MKLIYLAFARMPTEKAHGLTIAKSCEGFARAGAEVELFVPKRATPLIGDTFSVYGLERNFNVREVHVPDLIGRFGESRIAFWVHYFLFFIVVTGRLIFESRKTVIYSREPLTALYAWIGFTSVIETHMIPRARRIFFFLVRQAQFSIPISNALKLALVAAGIREDRIVVAPSGVDLSVFTCSVSKEEARKELDVRDGFVALYSGNFTTMGQDKGLHDIIEALLLLPKVSFVAVGGSQTDIERYASQARALGVSDRVSLRGYAPQAMLAKYQKAADVLLMPFPDTPHYRNHMSPVKMFEYMASERPIIASDLPTIREVLGDANAYIVPPDNPAALARTLQNVLDNTENAAQHAMRALHDVQEYSWDRRAQRILHAIDLKSAL